VKIIQKILIYRIANLGDIVCAIPAMVALRKRFPEAWISLLTNKETGSNPDPETILEKNEFLDNIITYNPNNIHKPKYLWDLLKKLRSLDIDLLVYLAVSKSTYPRLFRDSIFFRLSGCRKIVGFKMPKPSNFIVKNGIRMPIFPQEVDRLMSLVAPLDIDPKNVDFKLPIIEKDKNSIDKIWKKSGLINKKIIVAICPGAKFSSKRWPADRFSQVALAIKDQFEADIVLIGGPSEKSVGDEITKSFSGSIVNLIGKTTYMESAEAIKRCNLLISNDCGPGHLAAAVGTPVIGIYSSRDFIGAWHPWGNVHTILRNDLVSCRFCWKTECNTNECINGITVEQVINACLNYL
jgi:lipopolysaccharide heptosyltransferase II